MAGIVLSARTLASLMMVLTTIEGVVIVMVGTTLRGTDAMVDESLISIEVAGVGDGKLATTWPMLKINNKIKDIRERLMYN